MDRNKIFWYAGVVVVIIAVTAFVVWQIPRGSQEAQPRSQGTVNVQPEGHGVVTPPPPSPTRAAAPQNVVVPEKGSNVPANVAVPQTVAVASPNSSGNLRIFNIKVTGDAFIPDTIIVNAGDFPRLLITAVDKNYDFTQPDYGFRSISIARGTTKTIDMGSTVSGQFTFYCASCGGPARGPVGYLIAK